MIILLTTSGIGSRLGNITQFTNKALSLIGKKYVINYIIDFYKDKEDIKFIITLGHFSDFIKQYLNLAYPNIEFNYVNIDNYKDEGSSLVYSLLQCEKEINEPFIYTCCDAIFDEDIDLNFNENTLFVSDTNNSFRYSTISVNNDTILSINDKGAKEYDYMYTGVAYIKDFNLFFEEANNLYKKNTKNSQLSDMNVYQIMMKKNTNFNYIYVNKYFDIGSLDTYQKTYEYFDSDIEILEKNDESICFIDKKVIKFFHNSKKNLQRLERTKCLNKIIPKIYGHSNNFMCMEYINSKPISKIYKKNLIYLLLEWAQKNLWIKKHNISNFNNTCLKFYKEKTYDRIKLGLDNNKIVDNLIINNCNIGNIYSLLDKIDFDYLANGIPVNFHGDFILDNILLKEDEFILIDWRENFGNNIEYGDIYYDLSKLRHNIFFNHLNINNKLYTLTNEDNNLIVDMKCNYYLIQQIEEYDKFIKENNYDLKKIKILTAIIWINMAPLHTYPLSNFLFNLGKYNLYLYLE